MQLYIDNMPMLNGSFLDHLQSNTIMWFLKFFRNNFWDKNRLYNILLGGGFKRLNV